MLVFLARTLVIQKHSNYGRYNYTNVHCTTNLNNIYAPKIEPKNYWKVYLVVVAGVSKL